MNDLVDRYVHAVARKLPADSREDVALELRATIGDMVDARLGEQGDAVRDTLIELGDPAELAKGYRSPQSYLIGPGYFEPYRSVVAPVLGTAVPVLFAVEMVSGLATGDAVLPTLVGALASAFTVGVQILFWITAVFVVLERTGTPLDGSEGEAWSPDDLGPVPPVRQFSVGELVGSLIVLALIPIGLLWQRARSPFEGPDGPIPLLDPDLWEAWIPALLALVVIALGIEIWKYVTGHWTLPLVVANFAVNVGFVVWFALLFSTQDVWNPAYLAEMESRTDFSLTGSAIGPITVAVVIVISLWDTAESIVKLRRVPSAA